MTVAPTPKHPVLEIEDLHLEIANRRQRLSILRGVDLAVPAGGIHGLVGESGAGKTMIGRTVLGIQHPAARVTQGHIRFNGRDITHLSEKQRRPLLGRSMSMILQDPMTALNPVLRIQTQITDVLRHRLAIEGREARARALDLLEAVHIRDPERVLRQYPHELSGGMRQRVVISIAFACEPKLIIGDEPTTALDVTVQRQILRLIKEMQARTGTAILFITHNLGVVAKLCDSVSVIYAGRVLETARTEELFAAPQHPYTRALFAATPRYDQPANVLAPIPSALTDRLWQEAHEYDARQPGH
jgi:dipeptide transport system ATP-binding protein